MSDSPIPPADPGSQNGLTRAGALALAATTLAGSVFALHSVTSVSRAVPQAPPCPPSTAQPADWDDPHGCWERHGDRQYFRTTSGGRYYYHWDPPPTSRYYGSGGVGG